MYESAHVGLKQLINNEHLDLTCQKITPQKIHRLKLSQTDCVDIKEPPTVARGIRDVAKHLKLGGGGGSEDFT